ncbi:helicase-associated domain-containing protein [Nonomuraea maheshkhaliensis]|uniref:helicase-associated domain-containing protein n=1 Tax=Nonomuraea maheshkhaliensis TaxID=419590 RepID=UPI0031F86AF0
MALLPPALTQILRNRPELAGVPSVDLLERLLKRPELAIPALLDLDADCHVVSQAVQAAGGAATRETLAGLLHDPLGRLGEVLDTLAGHGLMTLDGGPGGGPDGGPGDDTVRSRHPAGLWQHPFGLGRPLREFGKTVTAETLKTIVRTFGGQPAGRKADLVRQAEELLADGAAVRARAARLPAQARAVLESMAAGPPVLAGTQFGYGPVPRSQPVERLVQAGFVIRDGWEYELPREIALALRGDGSKPALTGPPHVPAGPLPPGDGVDTALAAIERARALAELAATESVAELKAGGVGVREVRRVAKALGLPEQEAGLWLDVAFEADLIGSEQGERLIATTFLDDWLERPAGRRWRVLAESWLRLPQAPTHRVVGCCEEHMTPLPPPYGFACEAGRIRRAVLQTLRTLPPGLGAEADRMREAVAWRTRAMAEVPEAAGAFVAAALREAEWLGIVSGGALTTLGRALLDSGDSGGARPTSGSTRLDSGETHTTPGHTLPGSGDVDALFPAPVTTVTLQNDLTAVVTGVPSPELAAFLDLAADLESRDRASVWRFSESSVRRALDQGTGAETLLSGLARFAAKAIPQPLSYLITDTARRHGTVKVGAAPSVVIADDPAVIAELCAAKALRKAGLRRIAPTVALGPLPPGETLRLLRQAGHAPVGMAADGTIQAERPERRRLPVEPDPGEAGFDAEAAALLMLGGPGRPAPGSAEQALQDAAVTGEPIVIVWKRGEHYMDDLEFGPGTVIGYCHDCDEVHRMERAKIKKAYLL